MTNKEFAEKIIASIEHHKKAVCKMDGSPVDAAYAQAHEHIIELIRVEAMLYDV